MYAKLSATITRSSIWRESPATRCVWITLLALANKDGFVKGVEAWLASEANVSRDECREALRCFMEPDPESQDQDYGGRRVERQEGGWLVLNYPKYRAMRSQEQVLAAERQQRKRLKDKRMGGGDDGADEEVTARHAPSRSVTTIASAPASASAVRSSPRAREPQASDLCAVSGAGAEPLPAAGLAAEFAHEAHREAYLAMRTAHRAPAIFDASLRTVHAPPTGGQAFSWDTIGAGLVELAGNGETFNVARLRGYCRSHLMAGLMRGTLAGTTPSLRSTTGAAPSVRFGARVFAASELWEACVTVGLTSPMLSREMVRESVARLVALGQLAADQVEAFEACVLAIDPAGLAEIKFAKTREERLAERLAAWVRQAPERAA